MTVWQGNNDRPTAPDTGPASGPADLETLLKRHFGHGEFRPMQREIIDDAMAGRDVFVLMPTGGGKSLCFQLPALLTGGTTVVVSPLIALMQDQVTQLEQNGIRATLLNSTLDLDEAYRREQAALAGEYDLLYLAPERLFSAAGGRLLNKLDVGRFAIDEAHCISEWGHDFRPEYRMLAQLRTGFGGRFADTPVIALTATAQFLQFQNFIFRQVFNWRKLSLFTPIHFQHFLLDFFFFPIF